jgi:hypothetical protein
MLAALLRDPETQAFHAAAPQAGRLLRPLCQALGVRQPDWLRRPPRPRPAARRAPRPRPQGAAPPRPRTHPSPMLPTDRPLQGYVLRAADAWKKPGT